MGYKLCCEYSVLIGILLLYIWGFCDNVEDDTHDS